MIEINSIIASSNNVTLRKVNVKPYGFDKMYMDKEFIEDKLYRFSERKITSAKFYSILFNKIYPFYDGNGRTCKILFANYDVISLYTSDEFKLYIYIYLILYIYIISWSLLKVQKMKIRKFQGQKKEE